MSAMKTVAAAKNPNLLLCLDAFGTLFAPKVPIPIAYAEVAAKHGINCGEDASIAVGASFKQAFKAQSKQNPNYGRATGLGPNKWWANVIRHTFKPFLQANQEVPPDLINDLLVKYLTKEGYKLYHDADMLFEKLRSKPPSPCEDTVFPAWDEIVVGIITNSDDRVPHVLESFGLNIGPGRVGAPDKRAKKANLRDDINFVVLSYDAGVEKPDRKIFDAAVDMLRDTLADQQKGLAVDSFEKLYVGDDVQKDYHGAKAAGWHSLLIKRDGDPEDHNSSTDPDTITSLTELASFGR